MNKKVSLFCLSLLFFLASCDDSYVSKNSAKQPEAEISLFQSEFQEVFEVDRDSISTCLAKHKDQRIISITAVARTGDTTKTFLIVFDKNPAAKTPTCPECGQIVLEKKDPQK